MEKTHPKQYKYCIEKLGIGRVLSFIGVPYTTKIKGRLVGEQMDFNNICKGVDNSK